MVGITLNAKIHLFAPFGPGSVQWDGKYVGLGDGVGTIHRFTIVGGKGTQVGKTTLDGSRNPGAFWILGTTVVSGNRTAKSVMIWRYPNAGQPIRTISNVGYSDGVAVSVAASGSRRN